MNLAATLAHLEKIKTEVISLLAKRAEIDSAIQNGRAMIQVLEHITNLGSAPTPVQNESPAANIPTPQDGLGPSVPIREAQPRSLGIQAGGNVSQR